MLDADLARVETLQGTSRSAKLSSRDSQIGYVIIRHGTINITRSVRARSHERRVRAAIGGPAEGGRGGWERKSLRIAIPWPDIN